MHIMGCMTVSTRHITIFATFLPLLATCFIETTMSPSICMLQTWFAYQQIHIDSVNILIYKPCLQHAYYGMYDRFREACHHLCHILPRLATCLIETTMSRSICMLETWFAYQQIHIDSVNILIYKPCLQHAYYGMYDRFREACLNIARGRRPRAIIKLVF